MSATITDMICCPGLDYCALANARSIPLAQDLSRRFADPGARRRRSATLKIKISGCINACGHHHVGHIGILGVEKKGTELYQITIGGDATENAAIGAFSGPGFTEEELPVAMETLVDTYLGLPHRAGRDLPCRLSPAWRYPVQGGALWHSLRPPSAHPDPTS